MTQLLSSDDLFSEFGPVTAEQWAAKITKDLKGVTPAELVWQSYEGIDVAPFYMKDHRPAGDVFTNNPGHYPFVRTAKTQKNNWLNLQSIRAMGQGRDAIDKAADVLTKGADGIHFLLENATDFDTDYLIKQLDLAKMPVSYTVPQNNLDFLPRLLTGLRHNKKSITDLQGFILCAPHLPSARFQPLDAEHAQFLLEQTKDAPNFYALTINGAHFSNKGATLVQEVAFSLAIAVGHINDLASENLPVERLFQNMQFHVTAGTNFFFEIAKFRALRLLWAKVVDAFGASPEVAGNMRLHASTSRWHQTTLDPHTNLLRHTTEMMSAVMGGVNSLEVAPFDSTFQAANAFSERIARNISIILKEEAYLDQAIDPAAGSYYIEYLTKEIAQKAWTLFQDIEGRGGFTAASNSGFIHDLLKETTNQKFKDIATGDEVILGTNKYANATEQHGFDPQDLIQSKQFDSTRAAYPYEVMRFATEMHLQKKKNSPYALVVHLGNAIQEHIHATFAREFFMCSGFTTKVVKFDTPSAALAALKEINVQAIVVAAPEKEFAQFAEAFGRGMRAQNRPEPILILANDPMHLKDELRANGFDEFLFQGCDTAEIISRIQERLGT